jgi:hypothetical protein
VTVQGAVNTASFDTTHLSLLSGSSNINANGETFTATGTTSRSYSVTATTAGTVSGSIKFLSNFDNLSSQTLSVAGTINNHAVAGIQKSNGSGQLSQSGDIYTLDLGQIDQNSGSLGATLDIFNNTTGPADQLNGGNFTIGGGVFNLIGFSNFAGVLAGNDHALAVALDSTTAPGTYNQSVTFIPTGSNTSGFNEPLSPITIHLVGRVVSVPEPYCALLAGAGILYERLRRGRRSARITRQHGPTRGIRSRRLVVIRINAG